VKKQQVHWLYKLGGFRFSVLAGVIILAMIALGFAMATHHYNSEQAQLSNVQATLSSLQNEHSALLLEKHQLETRLALAELAASDHQEQVAALHRQLAKTSSSVSFYRNVMAPESVQEGFVVDGLQIRQANALPERQAAPNDIEGSEATANATTTPGQPQDITGQPQYYVMEFVLLQRLTRRAVIKGDLKICIKGSLANEPAQICSGSETLLPDGPVDYRFKFFQTVRVEFSLPEGFVAQQILFSSQVYQYTTKREDYRWQVDWQQVIANNGEADDDTPPQ